MTDSFGPGVSRNLNATNRQFAAVVWQLDKPPLDSELNLMSQVEWATLSETVRAQVHSGFLLDPTRSQTDFVTDPLWTNQFVLSQPAVVAGLVEQAPTLLACVNGWVFPVAGVDSTDGLANRVRLNPPPSTDKRTDFVFLEVWLALVSAPPSVAHKPTSTTIWKYGNTQFGGTNLPDDLIDPAIGFETTKRVQLQYRVRVVGSGDSLGTSVDLVNYPDGLTDPQVRAQSSSGATTGFAYTNMRRELGDPSLWRAGDGDPDNALGTVDGYVYAIPISAIFRRNTASYTSLAFSGNPNHNGSVNRTPSSALLPDPRNGARALLQATLTSPLGVGTTGAVGVTNLVGSGLEDPLLFPTPGALRFVVLGEGADEELVAIDSVSTGGSTMFIDVNGRGRGGSAARTPPSTAGRRHPAGTKIRLYNTCPSGLYADQIAPTDILDLRRSVNPGDWDYDRLLQHAVASLTQRGLRTAPKASGTGGNTFGVTTTEVAYLHSPLASPLSTPNQVDQVDGPDGLRTVWSDSAAVQGDVSVILDPTAPIVNGIVDAFDTNSSLNWAVSADFQPHGFLNDLGASQGWTNGTTIFLHIGGVDGTGGARYGLTGGQKSVRFVAPYEAWLPDNSPARGNQAPWRLRFIGGPSGNSTTPSGNNANGYIAGRMTNTSGPGENPGAYSAPGPMYPVRETNFERPFIVLGDLVNSTLRFSGVVASSANFINPAPGGDYQINIPGQNWDTFDLSLHPFGPDGKTLRDYLTNDGQDFSGASSRLYVVIYGDNTSRDNNGAFKVIGAGTVAAQTGNPYTTHCATVATGMIVVPLSADFQAFANSTRTVTIEFRSQEIGAEGDNGKNNPAGIAVVMTDLRGFNGQQPLPWSTATPPLYIDGSSRVIPLNTKAVLDMDVMWYPSRGASTRVPDRITRFACVSSDSTLVRTLVSAIDPNFVTEGPYPDGERFYEPTQIQLWNRLPSRGLYQSGEGGTTIPGQWGGSVVGSSESDREAELFTDPGSKTVVYRPFSVKNMVLKGVTTTGTQPLVGNATYASGPPVGSPVDGAGIFTVGGHLGYQVPFEYMPRFGRQDIPYHVSTGAIDPVMPGINHLFADQPALSDSASVFWIVGGENNATTGALVSPMLFATGASGIPYCLRGTISGALHPAYGARKQYYFDVVSSDFGLGLHGIELPPYHGVARVYGVYEYNDFVAHLSGTYPGAFQADRLTPIADPPRNLLKVGADKQTLYIRQGGGVDVTESEDAHTYVIPESALDLTNIPGYTTGQGFVDFDYVVECVVFGFASGFINKNNFVLARRKTGIGSPVVDGDNPELPGTAMVLASAAAKGGGLYEAYTRTVYQGDPYMTRDGSTVQPADYRSRYGQIPQASAYRLYEPIQQFDPTTGAMTVTRPNPRALEVLATLDFYTTLGTGKMGGRMWPGTPVDCGYTNPEAGAVGRIPETSLSAPWTVLPRAFTAGQNGNSTYAALELVFKNYTDAITYHLTVTVTIPGVGTTSFTAPNNFTGVSNASMASALAARLNLLAGVRANAVNGTLLILSTSPGTVGNRIWVGTSLRPSVSPAAPGPYAGAISDIVEVLLEGELRVPVSPRNPIGGPVTGSYLRGGVDAPVNGGVGDSMVSLTGMTECLPLGILVSDSDFIAENVLGDRATSLQSFPGGVRAVYQDLPLTRNGLEYTRFVNDPGSLLALSDGSILRYIPYTPSSPSGTTSYRIYRGGGATFVLSGDAPGGPVSWVSESFAPALKPVLKGAGLACKALLVRNYEERAFTGLQVRTEGDELQLVVLTYAVYGTPDSTENGVVLSGVISPTGYGEGYAAADRYLLPGRPMDRGHSRTTPPPSLQPAPYFQQ